MKVDYTYLKDLLGSYINDDIFKIEDKAKYALHKEWFKACFSEAGEYCSVSLKGLSVYKFLCTVDEKILDKIEPEGLYDIVNFWLIKKAEVVANELQTSDVLI